MYLQRQSACGICILLPRHLNKYCICFTSFATRVQCLQFAYVTTLLYWTKNCPDCFEQRIFEKVRQALEPQKHLVYK